MKEFLLGGMLFAVCVACGVFAGKRYEKAFRFWTTFRAFNALCAIRIPAFCTDIFTCIAELSESEFKELAFKIAGGKALKQVPDYLKEEEIEYLYSYFHKVKTADFRNISAIFAESQGYLTEKEKTAHALYEKHAAACRKLGVLGGIAAFIFVV